MRPIGQRIQLGAGGLCVVLAAGDGPGSSIFGLGAAGALAAVVWSLLPFMRTDGYWVLCDLLGLDDLDRPPPAGASRFLVWFVALFRVANGVFLCLVVFWFPQRIFGLVLRTAQLAGLDPRHDAVRTAAGMVAAALINRAIGEQLTCVFVDNGLLRKDEVQAVEKLFGDNFQMNLVVSKAEDFFLDRLVGISSSRWWIPAPATC